MFTPEDLRRITEHSKTIVPRAKVSVETAKETVRTATELCKDLESGKSRRKVKKGRD